MSKSIIILLFGILIAVGSFLYSVCIQGGGLFENENLYKSWLVALSITDKPLTISYPVFFASLVLVAILVFLPWYFSRKTDERIEGQVKALEGDLKVVLKRIDRLYGGIEEVKREVRGKD